MSYNNYAMEKGKLIACIAILITVTTCSKPNLNGVADGVVGTMQGISSDVSQSMKGGFTLEESRGCQQETIKFDQLELPTKAVIDINITPESFKLYTEENAYTDFEYPTWYIVDLATNTLRIYTKNWLGWDDGTELKLPPPENINFIAMPDKSKVKTKLDIKNPFALPRKRLGVRLGFGTTFFSERDASIVLSEAEHYGVMCAGALNSHYEALMKTEYDFKK